MGRRKRRRIRTRTRSVRRRNTCVRKRKRATISKRKMRRCIAKGGSSVGRARNSWSEGPGFDPRSGRPLPIGWVGVSIM